MSSGNDDLDFDALASNNPDGTPQEMIEAHYALSRVIQDAVRARAAGRSVRAVEEKLQGVAVGMADPSRPSEPGNLILEVMTREPVPDEEIRSLLTSSIGRTAALSVPLRITVTGVIQRENKLSAAPVGKDPYAEKHQERYRPVLPGISIGRADQAAVGTLGCIVIRSGTPKVYYLLTCDHVIGKDNTAKKNDPIVQPGVDDKGKMPNDWAAKYHSSAPIDFSGAKNSVDCAIAELVIPASCAFLCTDKDHQDGRQEFGSSIVQDWNNSLGEEVGKSGRSTGVTKGKVSDVNVTVRVWSKIHQAAAVFAGQIGITGIGEDFTGGGDSGSAVWLWPPGGKVGASYDLLGLHFAASDPPAKRSFSNPMQLVVDQLGIEIVRTC